MNRVGKMMVLYESVLAKLISSETSCEKRKQPNFHVVLRTQLQPASISPKLNLGIHNSGILVCEHQKKPSNR